MNFSSSTGTAGMGFVIYCCYLVGAGGKGSGFNVAVITGINDPRVTRTGKKIEQTHIQHCMQIHTVHNDTHVQSCKAGLPRPFRFVDAMYPHHSSFDTRRENE